MKQLWFEPHFADFMRLLKETDAEIMVPRIVDFL